MGQKINPTGFRIGVIYPHNSMWFARKKDFPKNLKEDYLIRENIKKRYYDAAISNIVINRAAEKITVDIHTAKPGVAIGKPNQQRGEGAPSAQKPSKERGIDDIINSIKKIVGNNKQVFVNIIDIKNAELVSQLVAENIAAQLERRTPFRRAMKGTMSRTIKAGAKGIKVMVSGRLDGNEIARSESYHEGSIPLQTLRADIDYGFAEAHTTYGVLGVKVWIYKGEVFSPKKGGK